MKKTIAIICAIAVMLSFAVPVFAFGEKENLDFLANTCTSAEQNSAVSFEVNKPLNFLSILNEEVGLDAQYLVESLLKSKINMTVKSNMSEDMKSLEAYVRINPVVPVEVSEDMKFSADINLDLWVKMDLTSEEDSCFMVIVKNPVDGNYLYMDLFDESVSEYVGDARSELTTMLEVFNRDTVKEVNAEALELVKKYATVKNDGEYVVVSFTNDAFVEYVFDFIDKFYFNDNSPVKNENVSEALKELGVTKEVLTQAEFMVKGLGILADNDAMVSKYKLDKDGNIKDGETKIRFDFNLFDVLTCCGLSEADIYPLTRDISDIDLTIVGKTEYTNLNNTTVTMPVLTEENSKNIFEDEYSDYYPDSDYEIYQPKCFFNYVNGMIKENDVYVNMSDFSDTVIWDEDNLGCTVLLNQTSGDVILTFKSDNFDTVKITGNVNSDTYYLNGVAIAGNKPFENVDGVLFAKSDVLNCVLGAEISGVTVSYYNWYEKLDTPEFEIELIRPNPGYTEESVQDSFDAAIGIIGGADGPTAIFTTEQ